MKTLRNAKNKTFVFTLISKNDANGNTYKAFTGGYWIKDGERHYFTDHQIKDWNPLVPFNSYADAYDDVKQWLNNSHKWGILWISEFKNVVVFCSEVGGKEFDRTIKQ